MAMLKGLCQRFHYKVHQYVHFDKLSHMRLWSLHPRYLDAKGLVALWREGLLAQHVLQGRTKGYRNHPQLERFKAQEDSIGAINEYLWYVLKEAEQRGYRFDVSKIPFLEGKTVQMKVTQGQLDYEWLHLKNKLQQRTPETFLKVKNLLIPEPHPLFLVRNGPVESWEKI